MDDWVAAERDAAGRCPACGQDAARPIVYGMPRQIDVERLHDVVEFAGCCIPVSPRRFLCGECGARWGRPAWARVLDSDDQRHP